MQVDDIKQKELTQSERDVLKEDATRWHSMGAGGSSRRLARLLAGLAIRRRLAMRMAFTNKPEGKGYMPGLRGADEGRRLSTLWTRPRSPRCCGWATIRSG